MNSKVYTIVLNWNGEIDTIECVKSLFEMDTGPADNNIVIVDNGSEEKSLTKIKEFISKKPIHLIETGKNLGFAEGNNVGIRYALSQNADFVMVLNNDTIVGKSLLKEFLKYEKDYPKAGVFSPKIYFAEGFEFHKKEYQKSDLGKVIWYAGGIIDWKNVYGGNRGVDEVDEGQYDKIEEIEYATGACMFLRAKAIESSEFFNKSYFMYLEDADYSLRLKKLGWKIIYVPSAILWHKVAQSSGIGSGLNDYYTTRNRMLFGMKFANLRAKFALIRESAKLLFSGREWQKKGILDFYLGKFEKGSWE